jgi:hypothetical protein
MGFVVKYAAGINPPNPPKNIASSPESKVIKMKLEFPNIFFSLRIITETPKETVKETNSPIIRPR